MFLEVWCLFLNPLRIAELSRDGDPLDSSFWILDNLCLDFSFSFFITSRVYVSSLLLITSYYFLEIEPSLFKTKSLEVLTRFGLLGVHFFEFEAEDLVAEDLLGTGWFLAISYFNLMSWPLFLRLPAGLDLAFLNLRVGDNEECFDFYSSFWNSAVF